MPEISERIFYSNKHIGIAYSISGHFPWLETQYCTGNFTQSYTTLSDAIEACEKDSACNCIGDKGCNGDVYYTFNAARTVSSSFHQCAWIKGTLNFLSDTINRNFI